MRLSYEEQVKGRTVIDASGRSVGSVADLYVEAESVATGLMVSGIRIKLHSEVADELAVARGTFHPAVIEVPARALQAFGDAVILNVTVGTLVQPGAPAPGEAH
jgi:sporulation protein YlmC with PRC-barrel domain